MLRSRKACSLTSLPGKYLLLIFSLKILNEFLFKLQLQYFFLEISGLTVKSITYVCKRQQDLGKVHNYHNNLKT